MYTKLLSFVMLTSYADDFLFWFAHPDIRFIQAVLQEQLNIFSNYLGAFGLQINFKKSNIICFYRCRTAPVISIMFEKDLAIEQVSSLKYLGFTFDSKLTYKQQITDTCSKCIKFMNLMRFLCGTSWGSNVKSMLIFYKATIRALTDFNFPMFVTLSPSKFKRLQIIVHQALRICTGALSSTPTHVLLTNSGEIPLYLRYQYLN